MNLGAGGNTFIVESTAANTTTTINTGSGNDDVEVRTIGYTTTIYTGDGNDDRRVGSRNAFMQGAQASVGVDPTGGSTRRHQRRPG